MNEAAYRAILQRLGVKPSVRETPPSEELARRVAAFRAQIEAWAARSGRIGVPLLVLPGAPEPRLGRCISCGQAIPEGWRCSVCLQAVYVALETPPPEDLSRQRAEETS